jgi:cytochrome c
MAIGGRLFIGAAALVLTACGSPKETESQSPAKAGAQTAATLQDPGKKAFRECAVCHVVGAPGSKEAAMRLIGPNLYGIVGRPAASVEGFVYSPAMQKSGLVWDEATLDRYLEKPMEVVPGNRMSFVGEKDAEKRAAIIAYLKASSPAQ